jgi:hypothetical protein
LRISNLARSMSHVSAGCSRFAPVLWRQPRINHKSSIRNLSTGCPSLSRFLRRLGNVTFIFATTLLVSYLPGCPRLAPVLWRNLGSIINHKSSIRNLSAGCPSLSRCCEGWGCQPAERLTTLGYIPASSRFLAVHHDSTSTTPCSPMA